MEDLEDSAATHSKARAAWEVSRAHTVATEASTRRMADTVHHAADGVQTTAATRTHKTAHIDMKETASRRWSLSYCTMIFTLDSSHWFGLIVKALHGMRDWNGIFMHATHGRASKNGSFSMSEKMGNFEIVVC